MKETLNEDIEAYNALKLTKKRMNQK